MSISLRDKQISTLEKMLNLNKSDEGHTGGLKNEEIIWKVLILDQKSRLILSSVLRVNDLLKNGITIHSLIDSKRSPLPDVPVVYFIEPTINNILHIIEDLKNDLYENFYINFTSSINRELLEEFAKKVSILGKSSKIKQVYDQYLNFIVTEPNLFSLNQPQIFTKFNKPNTNEDIINQLVDDISNGLLSSIITLDQIPIIRSSRGGPAEFVSIQLDLKLRDYLNNSRSSASLSLGISNQQRPVLVLLDRNIDLASMFSHSWIYQCMISDVFKLERNTIKLTKIPKDAGPNAQPTVKNYDIDPKDFFWNKYSQLPFPDVVENADIELNQYKKDTMNLTNQTGITSLNDINFNDTDSDTANIQKAVDALPELTLRKSTLDMHMDILASLINELQSKNLDKFFEIEQNLNDQKILQQFLNLLNETEAIDTSSDKLRTFLMLILLVNNLPSDYVSKVRAIFKEKYTTVDLRALDYVLKYKELTKLTNISNLGATSNSQNYDFAGESDAAASSNSSALLSGLSSKLYGLTEGKISEGLSSIASKVKNFIPEKKQLPITNVIEAIMDPTNVSNESIQLTDDYLYFDPKSRGGHSKPPRRQTYQEAQVFVIGGGNYVEYQDLQEWSNASNSGRKVIYGSTDILSPQDFLQECNELGQ
ncbi:Sec1-like protein [Suhomyces tanzawaensis NRRL Y-17324]|uniref:Sec1-like protein n=1 Tax=Suhomyces tanzawaensis NRRL Y-17324 TaxID=984487 RepID=A0A1E4SLX1_9ASCO|nr:Sec1-like protein [Suhomyces tanzawaensis NRRL Y-17324]ODV80524.1 Sec1-like protein [Suhomyces tanzawaensis NRRL Y-17324]